MNGRICFAFSLLLWQGRLMADNVPFTLSLFGPISTNPLSYEKATSTVCLGIINCANLNVQGVSAAYGYNRVFNDLHGVGFGLLGNLVSHDGRGVEAGLAFNFNGGEFRGLQISLLNITADRLRGAQIGFANYVDEGAAGVQFGGLNLAHGETFGAQMGYVNYAHGPFHGLQSSALNMSADTLDGVQFGAINSSAESLDGLQIGAINSISGIDDDKRMGVQIGFINTSNQARVVPVGLLNFVRGGRFNLEINRGRLGFNTLSLATGSRYFYGIWSLEDRDINSGKKKLYHPDRSGALWSGFGFGVPVTRDIFVKLERQELSPTNFMRDELISVRLISEFACSNYFMIQGGIEGIKWMYGERQRSTEFAGWNTVSYGVTAGVAINLLGWWTTDRGAGAPSPQDPSASKPVSPEPEHQNDRGS